MEFEMKDMEELKHFLGIQVQQDREHRQIYINQNEYINIILEKYDLANCNPIIIFIIIDIKLYKFISNDNNLMNNSKKYQFIIELQIYIILYIKLNLIYIINQIS